MKALLYAIIIVFISSQSVMATNKKINSDTVTTQVPNKKVKKVKKTHKKIEGKKIPITNKK